MTRAIGLARARRWFTEELRAAAPTRRNESVVDAFAAVPRERLLGPGPSRRLPSARVDSPFQTPDDDPSRVCHDTLVVIDAKRGIDNGQPSLWARLFDQLDLRPGERVLQVGAGTGDYAAILAELVGPRGKIVASATRTPPRPAPPRPALARAAEARRTGREGGAALAEDDRGAAGPARAGPRPVPRGAAARAEGRGPVRGPGAQAGG